MKKRGYKIGRAIITGEPIEKSPLFYCYRHIEKNLILHKYFAFHKGLIGL